MKILPHVDASGVNDAATAPSPVKVCMHVLQVARTDVRVLRAATALVEKGFAVCVVDVESERTRPIEEDILGICMKHIIMPTWFTPKRFRLWFFVKALQVRILGILRLMQTSAHIYHAHDAGALPACYLAARLRRKPLIFDAHELILPERNGLHWHWIRVLIARFLANILPRCAGVITVSPQIAQEISNRYHVPKVSVIRNVPIYRAVQKSDRLRQHLGLNPAVRIALYQGNLQPSSGLDKLVRAAAFLERDIVIILMGRGVGTTPAQLEALITSEGVADRVKILPPVPYTELLDWTASADIGLTVLPPDYSLSIQMCLPNKLFEYLMAGLPVLSSPLDAVADILRTYDVGCIVNSHEPQEIGRAISAMLADHEALARMRNNALAATQRDLCWESESQRLIHLYENILEVENSVPSSEETFDARRYWEQRLHAHSDITGVSHLGRSAQFVEQQYRSRMRRLELVLRSYGLADLAGCAVLDIGSGTGIWLDFWHRYGAEHVVGLDFAQPSIERLKAQFPDDLIVQADVSIVPLPLPKTMCFDVISAFDVLLHIVDPDAFRRTIANLAAHCMPNSWLIISDPIVHGRGYVPPPPKAAYIKVRSVAEYREVLEANGFVIDSIRPATVVLSDPLEAPNRLAFLALSTWWKVSGLWGRSNVLSSLVGPGVIKLDQLACDHFSDGNSPGAKMIFARKLN